ncbi:Hypothetical predicted protein [Olea europaea subsp. europaea]|uniref:Uncharacterized protein n=1 Tax=Olea europaea subsp. europaea TaxID=158383 RepID=A0A8S0S5I2_OLEEU|nr:Hypothetical predicted protein [Olea europaea subsp. europaea]
MDHFDDRQREDFHKSPFGYLAEVPEIQFSAQLIQQLLFRTIHTDKVNELWFNVQGNLMRFGLQVYTLVTRLRCGVFPEGDNIDRVLERRRLKERTVVGPQFNLSHAGSGSGGRLARQDSDDGVFSGGSAEDETSGDDDGDRQSGSDRDSDDTEDSGEGASERSNDDEDTRREQMGASSTERADNEDMTKSNI